MKTFTKVPLIFREKYENLKIYRIEHLKNQGGEQTVGKKTKKIDGCSEKFLLLRCINNTLLYNLIFIRKKNENRYSKRNQEQ